MSCRPRRGRPQSSDTLDELSDLVVELRSALRRLEATQMQLQALRDAVEPEATRDRTSPDDPPVEVEGRPPEVARG